MKYKFDEGQEYVLYGKASTGKTKVWKIRISHTPVAFTEDERAFVNFSEDDGNDYVKFDTAGVIETDNGYIDGELHTSMKFITEGKNLGKKNATTPLTQAYAEASSRVEKKIKQGYRFTEADLDELPVGPMKAQNYKDSGHHIEFPCYTQPKLNGVRCLAHKVAEDKIEFRSKRGELYTTLDHIGTELIGALAIGEIWDGEVYVHGWSLQRINSAVKKANEDTPNLEFHVFDMISEISPFDMRYDHVMFTYMAAGFDKVKLVPRGQANDEQGAQEALNANLAEGYEGVMLRNINSLYKAGFRSADLQKFKPRDDAEFKIIGHTSFDIVIDGIPKKACVYICETEGGKTFEVVPKGTMEERIAMNQEAYQHYGKMLTVQYAELSDDGVPLQPVGLRIREDD